MKKIFLLETSVEEQNRVKYDYNSNYSLGLAYLDSILKNEGHKVKTMDLASEKESNCLLIFENVLRDFKPDILGISIMSMTRVSSYKVIKIAKEINPKIKIIVGGIHSTIMFKQLLENFPIDCVVIGEAEETIKEIIKSDFSNKELKKIKGIAFKDNNEIIKTNPRELNLDIDKIPFPSHDIFINKKRKKICILSSRGCPFKCSFCSLNAISKRKYRARSPENVILEIEEIIKRFPQIKEIEFSDDTFTLNEERVIEFCKEIVKRNLKLKFVCSARIKPVSEEMFYWMEKAGFKEIRFGIETGSRKLLKSIHKNITPEDIIETFKIASKFPKIRFVKFLMVGFYGENEETIKETIELTKKIQKLVPMNFFYATPLWVYPGTEVYQSMKDNGKIKEDFWLSEKQCPYYTVEHKEGEIFSMSKRIAFETCLDRGYLFFTFFIIKKILKNPFYQIKRIFNIKN